MRLGLAAGVSAMGVLACGGCDEDRAGYTAAKVFETTRIESGAFAVPSDEMEDFADGVHTPEGCRGLLLVGEDAISDNPAQGNAVVVENASGNIRVLVFRGNDSRADCAEVFRNELAELP